jgi:hypothetical protein
LTRTLWYSAVEDAARTAALALAIIDKAPEISIDDTLKDFARIYNAPQLYDTDDTDPRDLLGFVMGVLLRGHESDKEKREMLSEVVSRFEVFLGVGYVPEPDLAHVQAIDLNRAGDCFAGRMPKDVPDELRKTTFDYWTKKQSELAERMLADPMWVTYCSSALPDRQAVVRKASHLVDTAIIEGAFIRTYSDMPRGQQLFWEQRALGIDHGSHI